MHHQLLRLSASKSETISNLAIKYTIKYCADLFRKRDHKMKVSVYRHMNAVPR